jgi:DNA-binding beta-propeller fold protein YncE
MISRFVYSLALLALGVSVLAQAPASEGPTLTSIWDLKGDFAAPESAYYHAASNSVFVSSINGQILDRDGNGYISRLSPDGKVISAKWVTALDAPKGMRSVDNTLWVADIDDVVSIDIAKGQITARVNVGGAMFLNDLATAPDGTVYVSDSMLSRIYAVKDGKSSVFVEGADVVEQPNGLLVDGSRLILGTIGPAPTPGAPAPGRGQAAPRPSGHLFAFDLTTKQRTQLTKENVGGIDGIEPDGSGGLLVTDVLGQRLLHVAKSGQVKVLAKFSAGGADFGYIGATRIAVVPFLFENRVAAYDLTNALR